MSENELPQSRYTKRNLIGLILGPSLFLLAYFLIPESELSHEPRVVLATTMLVATFWVTEAIPLAAASLVPLVLIPAFRGAEIETIAPAYSDPTIFMYGGGFVIALAIEKWNLHRRIALSVIQMIGSQSHRITLGIIISTAMISMFVSNAATALMMLPVAIALITEVKEKEIFTGKNLDNFSKGILLSVAYAATIGGLATLVAAVPNAVLAGIVNNQLDRTITFLDWLIFAGPVALVMLIVLYFYLTRLQFKVNVSPDEQPSLDFIQEDKKALGPFNRNEGMVTIAFCITVFFWVFKGAIDWLFASFMGIQLGLEENLHDGTIAVFGALLLFFLPSTEKGERILEWEDMKRLPWGVLILFGGGLALAEGFSSSGLNDWIGETLQLLEQFSFIIIILLLVTIVLGITEILSNTAVANLVIPLTVGMGIAIGIDPLPLMAAAALSAGSCYMLPVATPPNAAVFSAGVLHIGDMARAGVWLNLFSIIVITLAVYFWMPIAFNL
ncbi:DASS family sodium-coupled anion symporter [Salicibibacter halophilus]|uniref:Sodium-dependent dicarboxylate transporter SdcS n=1 Tax=Salicibibacter halophilus TaxID=2502791 RepID=A0A514LJS5_9BACI|nr:DASS family sodium-coupled anion symporter [Salicibibacter halophilus]QDI92072.1 DASS family sodium-coupled anion symporter [Salicibibacter halophilus]